jgi:hypothetical protein
MTHLGEDGKKPGKSGARDKRLAAALRENLRRRKAQERGRGCATASASPVKPAPAPRGDESR